MQMEQLNWVRGTEVLLSIQLSHLHENYFITICMINYPMRPLLAPRVIMQMSSLAY